MITNINSNYPLQNTSQATEKSSKPATLNNKIYQCIKSAIDSSLFKIKKDVYAHKSSPEPPSKKKLGKKIRKKAENIKNGQPTKEQKERKQKQNPKQKKKKVLFKRPKNQLSTLSTLFSLSIPR